MRNSFLIAVMILLSITSLQAQTNNDLLNVLTKNQVISQKQADSLRNEANKNAEQKNGIKSVLNNTNKALQITGFTQFRYQELDQAGKKDGFDLRRARVVFKGDVLKNWSYFVQFDMACSPRLLDAYANLKLSDALMFTFGQFKVPLSRESLISSGKLETLDCSQVVEALVARPGDVIGNQLGYDQGVKVSGDLFKLNDRHLLEYQLAVVNGAGINVTGDNNESKDLAGRMIVHAVKGLDLGGSFYKGLDNWNSTVNNVAVSNIARKRDRIGFDLYYTLGGASLQSEYLKGWDGNIIRSGYYVQAAYFVMPGKLQLLAKYDSYDPNKDVSKDKSNWYILGANYNLGPNSRLQVAYNIKTEEGTEIHNNMAAVQLQIGF
ncbi:MAG: porin [Bacteroidota bacterium]|nr:porin [Bacteroidota bacterium]